MAPHSLPTPLRKRGQGSCQQHQKDPKRTWSCRHLGSPAVLLSVPATGTSNFHSSDADHTSVGQERGGSWTRSQCCPIPHPASPSCKPALPNQHSLRRCLYPARLFGGIFPAISRLCSIIQSYRLFQERNRRLPPPCRARGLGMGALPSSFCFPSAPKGIAIARNVKQLGVGLRGNAICCTSPHKTGSSAGRETPHVPQNAALCQGFFCQPT